VGPVVVVGVGDTGVGDTGVGGTAVGVRVAVGRGVAVGDGVAGWGVGVSWATAVVGVMVGVGCSGVGVGVATITTVSGTTTVSITIWAVGSGWSVAGTGASRRQAAVSRPTANRRQNNNLFIIVLTAHQVWATTR
jgi:hypothetical protein